MTSELPFTGSMAHFSGFSQVCMVKCTVMFHLPHLSVRGWMIGFWDRSVLNRRVPPQCLSSRKCTRNSQGSHGKLLFRAVHTSLGPPLLLPLIVDIPQVEHTIVVIYARVVPPPCVVVHGSHPRHVSLPHLSWRVLTMPLARPPSQDS